MFGEHQTNVATRRGRERASNGLWFVSFTTRVRGRTHYAPGTYTLPGVLLTVSCFLDITHNQLCYNPCYVRQMVLPYIQIHEGENMTSPRQWDCDWSIEYSVYAPTCWSSNCQRSAWPGDQKNFHIRFSGLFSYGSALAHAKSLLAQIEPGNCEHGAHHQYSIVAVNKVT